MSKKEVTLIIPTHNEENIICERALKCLINQHLDDLSLKLVVIPNGCIDKTAEVASKYLESNKRDNITWKVVELKEGHRTRALNHGISLSKTDIVMYLNPDSAIVPNAVKAMYECISFSKELNYVGMLGEPDLTFVPEGTMLYKTLQLLSYNRNISNTHPPEGRFIAFRKDIFPEFPEIHSEDTWASLYSYGEYGSDSIKVLEEPTVKYIPYQNWADFMRVETRYMEGTQEVFDKFPGFKELNDKRVAESKRDDDFRHKLINEFCEENEIDIKFAHNIKDVIFPLIMENTKLLKQIDATGTWEIV